MADQATVDFQKAMDAATTREEVSEIIRAAQAAQEGAALSLPKTETAAEPVAAAEEEKHEEPVEETNEGFYQDIVIGGKEYHFEGDSQADIIRQIKAASDAHEAATKKEPVQETAAATKDDAEAKAALELDYRTGKISADEYLDKSGAFDRILEKRGLSVEALKETVQEKVTNKVNDQWNTAVDQFLKDNQDWPGGSQNETVMKYKLAELKLSSPSVESLNKAYAAMKAEGLVYQNQQQQAAEPVVEQPKKKLSGSGVFGVGSGVAKVTSTGKKLNAPKITPDMSPRDIMRAYKDAAQEQGIHPDELLLQSQA